MSGVFKEQEEVLASRPGMKSRPELATIIAVLHKGYRVRFKKGEDEMKLAASKIKPLGGVRRTPLPQKKPAAKQAQGRDYIGSVQLENQDTIVVSVMREDGTAIPKPPAPEKSPVYLNFIRSRRCCNCMAMGQSDPHHEGKRGVGQKVRDTKTVPLCRECHTVYTDTNCLPDPDRSQTLTEQGYPPRGLRTRTESLEVLHQALLTNLELALLHLSREQRIELLSSALANMNQTELRRALTSKSAKREGL